MGVNATHSVWERFADYAAGRMPMPGEHAPGDRALYGLAQPVLGMRLLLRERDLFLEALKPAMLLGCFCALTAALGSDKSRGFWGQFYQTFVALAPVPSVLFANHYARLAADAHQRLGFGPCEPRRELLWRSALHAAKQAVVVVLVMAPVVALAPGLPLFGKPLAAAIGAIWALHWVVVEALDSARVHRLNPQGPAEPPVQEVWFVRGVLAFAKRLPAGGFAARAFARLCSWLAVPWREEIAITESHPALVLGFALMTATVLAIPLVNLLFRPIILVASVHLRGQLRGLPAEQVEPQGAEGSLCVESVLPDRGSSTSI